MGVRQRKQHLIATLLAHKAGGRLTEEQRAAFEMMYRRCRTPEEQDQVTKAVHDAMEGWKTGTDRWSRLRQAAEGLDLEEDEDEDPPALKAALARSQITFLK